jgi:drug/metabolite transporter (DMT)-like permease
MDIHQSSYSLATLLATGSAFAWGTGDFSGGLASKRSSPLSVMLVATPLGLLLLSVVAAVRQAPMVTPQDGLFALLAGVCSAVGSLALYQALSAGKMGIAAPLTAVIANVISMLYGAVTEGMPHLPQSFGFLLAIVAVWIISKPQKGTARTNLRALLPAIVAGIGFGLFFSFSAQFTAPDISWAVVVARLTSCCVVVLVALISKHSFQLGSGSWPLVLLAGTMDSLGNLSYALATQVGRLDVGAALSSLYPIATVGLALFVLRERLTRVQSVGAALALAAIPLIVG